jgi:hypothetical protein
VCVCVCTCCQIANNCKRTTFWPSKFFAAVVRPSADGPTMRLSLCILFTIWGIFSVQPAQAALHLSDVAFLEDFCDAVVGLPATWVKTSALDACVTPPWLGITCQTFGSSQRIIAMSVCLFLLTVFSLTGFWPFFRSNLKKKRAPHSNYLFITVP